MAYEVLSRRGDVDPIKQIGLNPRVTDLNNAIISLYTTFKEHWPIILDEIAKQIKEQYPGARFTHFQYTKDLNSYTQVAEVAKDPEVRPEFEEWLKGCDTVIVSNADAGSCTLYLTYNTTLVEHLGKPVVMTVASAFTNLAKRAAELRGIPAFGFDAGCTMIMSPQLARFLYDNGFSRKDVISYVVEYARRPASSVNVRWMIGNFHKPKGVPVPADPTRSVRKFWSGLHLPLAIAGINGIAIAFYGGGGDHGGPITKKIQLPKNCDQLVTRYKDYEPKNERFENTK